MTDWDDYRAMFDRLSDHLDDWQGVPVHLPDMPLTLHDRHPLRDKYRSLDGEKITLLVGGPDDDSDEAEVLVNSWVSRKRQSRVYVFQRRPSGRAFAVEEPLLPDGAMNRLAFWLKTLGASDAWDLDAEMQAMDKLGGLLTPRQRRHYFLTGSFLETSPRSGLTYMFRRSRPTIVLTPHKGDEMMCLAVLCLHPIGYYQDTWAGAMVPSDDVIAHLLYMRADEPAFWKTANQHASHHPEAGL